jgi:transposase
MQATWSHPVADAVVFSNDFAKRRERPRRPCVVDCSLNAVKQWRGLATRYDKLALTYRGGAVLRAITSWLRQQGDTA